MCNIAKRPPMNNNEVTCTIGLLTENGCSTLIYLFNIFQDTLKGNAINDVTNCLIGISKHHITLPVDVTELNKIKKNTILWNCSFSKHRWSNWLHRHSTKSTFRNIYSSFEKSIIPWTFKVYAIRIWNFLILWRSGLVCYIKCALLTKFLNLKDAILQIMGIYELSALSAILMTE